MVEGAVAAVVEGAVAAVVDGIKRVTVIAGKSPFFYVPNGLKSMYNLPNLSTFPTHFFVLSILHLNWDDIEQLLLFFFQTANNKAKKCKEHCFFAR